MESSYCLTADDWLPESRALRAGLLAGSLLVALALGGRAEAALIAQFTGTVTSTTSGLAGGFTVGGLVTGSYRFDETTPDSDATTNRGVYPAIDDYRVQFGGSYAASATAGEISVRVPPFGVHTYAAAASPSGPNVSGLAPTNMVLVLEDSSQTALGSEALPVSLDPGNFDFRVFQLSFGEDFVSVDLETFSIIPEPATAALLGLGAMALGRRRRSR